MKRFDTRKYLLLIIDIVIVIISYFLAVLLKSNFIVQSEVLTGLKLPLVVFPVIYCAIFYIVGLYSSIWVYAGLSDYINIVAGNVLAFLGCIVFDQFSGGHLTVSGMIIGATFAFIMTAGIRILSRIVYNRSLPTHDKDGIKKRNILIIGAGLAGKVLINEIRVNPSLHYNIVGLIDDDPKKVGQIVNGIKVLGTTLDIPDMAGDLKIDEIILAIPSLNNEQRKRILDVVASTTIKIKTLPSMMEMMNSDINVKTIRDVEITDLLGRKEIKINLNQLQKYYQEKTILVTGGGGSIGSELCRQLANLNPRKLVIVDIYENNAYDIQNELLRIYPDLNLETLIASVRDENKINFLFERIKPDLVFHAAAHKHVPLMETSPHEAVKNNVFGTLNIVKACDKYGVERMLLISTDKAVNPTNVMGASKRICEMIIQAYNKISKNTDYVAVRFGNVLGSNGSVIPLFKRQIKEGGPLTVTHRDITRFFMTIPEAVQLVLTAGSMAEGGEIFVLDMGEPIKIYNLAENLIRLSGYEPNVDIPIKVTGLRPGEKLYEELLMDEEGISKTENSMIFIGKPIDIRWEELEPKLDILKNKSSDNSISKEELKEEIKLIAPTYNYK